MKRYLIPLTAFFLGSLFLAGLYFGILSWAQGWKYAQEQFSLNRWYVIPLFLGFGLQTAIYSLLRFRLFVPLSSASSTSVLVGANGVASTTTMVACCLHHVTDVLPILGLSAAATFLTRYQRPFMLLALLMNLAGILIMLRILLRERQKYHRAVESLALDAP